MRHPSRLWIQPDPRRCQLRRPIQTAAVICEPLRSQFQVAAHRWPGAPVGAGGPGEGLCVWAMWFDDAHGARAGPSSQGAPRRARRRTVTVVRGGRCLSGGARTGDAAAYRGDRSDSGGVPDDAQVGREPRRPAPPTSTRRSPIPSDPRHPRGDRRGGPDHRHPPSGRRAGPADPKPFLGTSDNTNLHHWLWANGIAELLRRLDPGPPRPRARASTTSTRGRCEPRSSPVRPRDHRPGRVGGRRGRLG